VSSPDAIVIGGGVMGSAIALRLASRGVRTLVLERSVPGAEASSVAAGILAPRIEHPEIGPALRLGMKSRDLHEGLAHEMRENLGIDVGFRRTGAMIVSFDHEREDLEARAAIMKKMGAPAEFLDGDRARQREPNLSTEVRCAIDLPDEAQVEPPLLLRALAIGAARAGAEFRSGTTVHHVQVERGRARSVLLDTGKIHADHVIIAAGSWTSLVQGLPKAASVVRPIRGQLLHCEMRPCVAKRVLFGAGGYVVPRPDGRVVCGATMEDVGFRREITLSGMAGIIARATRVVPALAHAELTHSAVNFRPMSPDELPLIGCAGPDHLWLATGHHRNGILLAPLTAELIADFVTQSPSCIDGDDARAIDPLRFANSESHS
jgi:glycine oxidase